MKSEKVTSIIKDIIIDENPSKLIEKGVNEYEFDNEIKSISKLININSSPKDISLIVKNVFKSSFGVTLNADYDKIGYEIYLKIQVYI